jgi:hypothetical protein
MPVPPMSMHNVRVPLAATLGDTGRVREGVIAGIAGSYRGSRRCAD